MKENELEELRAVSAQKNLPLKEGATSLVFGEGNSNSRVVFIGEAPGFHEDTQGRPFVGNAGFLLNKVLLKAGLKREDVYITNIIKYRPPENRDPTPDELAAFTPILVRQIEIINPTVIVTLGRFSMAHFLPKAKISEVHGKVFAVNGRIIVPMFHPAAALRRGEVMAAFESDFTTLREILKSPHDFLKPTKSSEDDSQLTMF